MANYKFSEVFKQKPISLATIGHQNSWQLLAKILSKLRSTKGHTKYKIYSRSVKVTVALFALAGKFCPEKVSGKLFLVAFFS
jgi:hypothetical protein